MIYVCASLHFDVFSYVYLLFRVMHIDGGIHDPRLLKASPSQRTGKSCTPTPPHPTPAHGPAAKPRRAPTSQNGRAAARQRAKHQAELNTRAHQHPNHSATAQQQRDANQLWSPKPKPKGLTTPFSRKARELLREAIPPQGATLGVLNN